MIVAKEFSWEMGHRLPFHKGKCRNLHGHSYKAVISFEGTPDEFGMVIDFYDMKQIVSPLIEVFDHAFALHKEDTEIIAFLKGQNSKLVVLEFHSTAENICDYLLSEIAKRCPANINALTVRLYETEDAYAENTRKIR